MKRTLLIPVILAMAVVLGACVNKATNNAANNTAANTATNGAANGATSNGAAAQNDNAASEEASGTITYASETGDVQVPANPQRIVALTNAPNVISLGGKLVGVDEWTNKNPLFTDKLAGVQVVSDSDLEKIVELDPDLIIGSPDSKNLAKLKEIAPTVVYTWGKLDYLNQQLEIGKLLNKEKEAQAWMDDFKQRANAIGKEVKAKIGENATVSVFETDSRSFYVFGDAWARGTEVLYQTMGLKMPEKVKADTLSEGYHTLSSEVLSQYAGDWIVLSRSTAADNSFMNTDSWKNIPAVKNNHVIVIDTEASTYSDPTTLEYLLNIFKEAFLGSK
ncbi:iron-hydroxamate ABC transporter substrate-binding protein [Paenibacillus rhizovicinus]|uniref:Iron-hydroxamate ABC transporter substrate-binding protein n=1 Tax=Paenibacillus rhizovicinus TaxID=2704463 RepID=A0A6C0P0R3_9BACL|nr:iron-hydroxamate ABC transporter substrate-binding protein [Paenibacillus rhizovicinus]QHW32074.1 iron-hydroxamate ABC transporter substrate-binding protein [Paenibacillus rhizovicinus]